MLGSTATQSAEGELTGLARLPVKAKQDRSLRFSHLLHPITPEIMENAYKSLNRQSAKLGAIWQRIVSTAFGFASTYTHRTVQATAGATTLVAQTEW
jgi:hypothetical protein